MSNVQGELPQLRPSLQAAVKSGDLSLDDRIIDALEGELEECSPPEFPAQERHISKMLNRDGYYIVRDDDFRWLSSTVSAVVKLIRGAALGMVPDLIAQLYRYRRQGAEVSPQQGIILAALKRAPSTGIEVGDLLPTVDLPDLTDEILEQELRTLQRLARRDGRPGDFVVCIDGLWLSRV